VPTPVARPPDRDQERTTAAWSLRDLLLSRWSGQVVELRTVALTAAGTMRSAEVVFRALAQVTGPHTGVAQVVAGRRQVVLAVAATGWRVDWSWGILPVVEEGVRVGETRAFSERTGALWRAGCDFLVRHGEEGGGCYLGCEAWFRPEEPVGHPVVLEIHRLLSSLYRRAREQADETAGYRVGRAPTLAQTMGWVRAERRARRDLIGLALNPRVIDL
jgi:hypothetical protein